MEYLVKLSSRGWSEVDRKKSFRSKALILLILVLSIVVGLATRPAAAGSGGTTADIVVTKSGDKTAPFGGLITYSITATNSGPDTADNVVLTDQIPAHTQFVNASVSQGSVSFDGTTITANFGNIAVFESGGLSLTVRVNNDTPRDTVISNTANATSDTADPDLENNYATFTTTIVGPFPGDVLISEFRFRGPTPTSTPVTASADEFIEIYNNTDAALIVTDAFGSNDGTTSGQNGPGVAGGWAVVSSDNPGTPKFVIPSGTTIPARGHILAVNSNGYSLNGYPAGTDVNAVGDITYTVDIPDSVGIALFRTANSSFFSAANRFDAVGFSSVIDPVYREGNGLGVPVMSDVEHSFVRKLTTGLPQDSDNNLADFALVATDGNLTLPTAQLGSPGPENSFSPIQHNSSIKASLIEPLVNSNTAPNRLREGSGDSGTLSLRRRFHNVTGGPVTRLRFRVVNITTLGTPISVSSQADVRLITSDDFAITTSLGALTVHGTVVEEPPAQNLGGGLNTSAVVFLPGGALVPGASIDLQFLLSVAKSGNFRFLVNVESLDTVGPPPERIQRTTGKLSAGQNGKPTTHK